MRYSYTLSTIFVFLLLCGCEPAEKQPAAKADARADATVTIRVDSVAKQIRSRAFKYIASNQNSDGSYGWRNTRSEATAIVVAVFAESARKYSREDGPFLSRAIDFILRHQNKDGSFGSTNKPKVTSLSLRALKAVDSSEFIKAVSKGELFLKANPVNPVPGPMESIALETRSRMVLDKWPGGKPDLQWIYSTVNRLKEKQHLADDTANNYGSFDGSGKGIEKDPVISTAFAALAADLFERNWKKVKGGE